MGLLIYGYVLSIKRMEMTSLQQHPNGQETQADRRSDKQFSQITFSLIGRKTKVSSLVRILKQCVSG